MYQDKTLPGAKGRSSGKHKVDHPVFSEEEYTYFEDDRPTVHFARQSLLMDQEELSVMHRELRIVSAQLKTKHEELINREASLDEREMKLDVREKEIEKAYEKLAYNLHKTVDKKNMDMERKSKQKVLELQGQNKEKAKENKRLRNSFDTLQEVNAQLRKQLEELQGQHSKLDKQSSGLRQRLENLQRCQEFKDKQTENIIAELKVTPVKTTGRTKSKGSRSSTQVHGNFTDVFLIMLDWTIQEILKPSYERGKALDGTLRVHILENCQRVLPSLAEIIREAAINNRKLCLPCLQFVYWSCLLLEQNPGKQNVGLSSTQRRLAEELYKPLKGDENEPAISTAFVKSPDLQIRMLSHLLLLRTLTQVDCIAKIFTLLKQELRDELSKELFIHYHGSLALLAYFKPTSKAHLGTVLDIYLLMCVESTMLRPFLSSCSNEEWFRSVTMVMKIPSLDQKQMEKISVILQKLSKVRENKKLFDMFQLRAVIQDSIHSLHPSDSNSFLILNLKSILYNLSP